MPRTLKKDILRLIKTTKGRFFSLTAIVMIGVAFFVGVSSSSTIMADNVDAYSDRVRLKDITIYSDYGFDDIDVKAISDLEEVEYAEGSKFVDVNASDGTSNVVARVHSYDPQSRINLFDLVEGRLPEKKNEVLSEAGTDMEPGYPVGTVLYFSRPDDDLEDWLNVEKVTVVGTIDTPLYLNMTKENSTLANQYIQTYFYIPEEAFAIDYDLEVNVLTKKGTSMESFYEAYETYCKSVKEGIEDFGVTQVMHRHDEVLNEAYEKLNDGWQEYYDGEKEFNDKIAEAEQEIADAEKEIADGWNELNDGVRKLQDAQTELDEAELDGYRQIEEGRAEIEKGREKLKAGESEYYELEAEYLALKDQIDDGIQQIKEGIAKLKEAKEGLAQIDAGIEQIDNGIEQLQQAKSGIEQIDQAIAQIDEALPQLEEARDGLSLINTGISALDGIASVLQTSLDSLDESSDLYGGLTQDQIDRIKELIGQIAAGEETDCSQIDFAGGYQIISAQRERITELLSESGLDPDTVTVGELISDEELLSFIEALGYGADANISQVIAGIDEQMNTVITDEESLRQACDAAVALIRESDVDPQVIRDALEELSQTDLTPDNVRSLLSDALSEVNTQKAALEAQRDEIRNQLYEQGIDPDNIDGAIADLTATREELVRKRAEIEAQLAEQSLSYDTIDDAIGQLEAQKKELLDLRAEIAAQLAEQDIDADQIDEKITELEAQIAELENNKKQIDEGLAMGKAALEDARDTLDKAYMATVNAAAELIEEVDKAQKEINDGWKEIEENRQKLTDAEAELEDGRKELEDARRDGLQELADARAELDKAQQDIDDLEDGSWTVLDRSMHYASKTYKNTVEQMAAIGAVFPLFFFMVAALVCLTTMTRMIDEQRSQLGIMRALGYSRFQCSMKYLMYAGMATLLGTALGVVLGLAVFPYIIYTAWKMMYVLPPMKIYIPWKLIVISALGFLAVMLMTTWSVCSGDMNDVPSQLLRPKSPKLGKTALIERIGLIWNRLNFSWKITTRNLFRYKQRLIMTVIGVAGCTALLITGFGISDSINGMVDIQFDELQLFEGQVHAEGLKPSEISKLRNDLLNTEHVKAATVAGSYSAIAVNGTDPLEETVNVEVFEKPEMILNCYNLRTRTGHTPIVPDDEGAIINEKLAENLGLKAGDTIIVESKTGVRKEVRISAVTEMYIQHYMFMTQKYYTEVFGNPLSLDTLMVDIDGDMETSREFQKEIVNDDRVSGIAFYDTVLENFKSMVNSLDLIVWALIISSMSLAFVVLGNLTNINISERQREIATLKVLGFRRREVQDYIFKENNVLTALGALAGIPIGQVLHHFIMRQVEMDYVMFGRKVDLSSNIMSFFMTIMFGMLVNFFMRKRLTSIEMVESLKSVE